MSEIHKKRPRDPNERAAMITRIATGEEADIVEDGKSADAKAIGRLGGLKGGKARADKLSPEKRKAIAQKAAKARWGKN